MHVFRKKTTTKKPKMVTLDQIKKVQVYLSSRHSLKDYGLSSGFCLTGPTNEVGIKRM